MRLAARAARADVAGGLLEQAEFGENLARQGDVIGQKQHHWENFAIFEFRGLMNLEFLHGRSPRTLRLSNMAGRLRQRTSN